MSLSHPGPTSAESRLFVVCDTFYTLLERQPTAAARLAYELDAVAQKYAAPPHQNQKGNPYDTRIRLSNNR